MGSKNEKEAAQGAASGDQEEGSLDTQASRTYGSLYEREVPSIALNPQRKAQAYGYSKDIAAYLFQQ